MEALVSIVTKPLGRMVSDLSRSVLFVGLAAVLFITSYGAFLAAVAYLLSPRVGPAVSSLIIAVVTLAVGVAILLWLRAAQRRIKRRRLQMSAQAAARTAATTSATTKVATSLLPRMLKHNPTATLVLIAAALYVAARSR